MLVESSPPLKLSPTGTSLLNLRFTESCSKMKTLLLPLFQFDYVSHLLGNPNIL